MGVTILLLYATVLVSGAPGTPASQTECDGDPSIIALTPNGWNLPFSTFSDYQSCEYQFIVPFGYYAYVDVRTTNLQHGDIVKICDRRGTLVTSYDTGSQNFSVDSAWPTDFFIQFNTGLQTVAQFSIDISVFQATPTANIVKSYVTFPGCESVFLDSDSWSEGESYKFASKTGSVVVAVASTPSASQNDLQLWNNVFIYEDGVLRTTLATLAQHGISYVSENEVTLYMAKKVEIAGAAMITDSSNIERSNLEAIYVPTGPTSFSLKMDSRAKQSAITLISSKKNLTNVTVYSLTKLYPRAVFSYVRGGPKRIPSTVANISEDDLPLTIPGYANTFYLSEGDGVIDFEVTA